MIEGNLGTLILYVILPLLLVAVALASVRLLRGPHLSDRVVALDLMVAMGIGIIACYAIVFQDTRLLDVAAVIALISFMGTIAFAHYLQRRAQ